MRVCVSAAAGCVDLVPSCQLCGCLQSAEAGLQLLHLIILLASADEFHHGLKTQRGSSCMPGCSAALGPLARRNRLCENMEARLLTRASRQSVLAEVFGCSAQWCSCGET